MKFVTKKYRFSTIFCRSGTTKYISRLTYFTFLTIRGETSKSDQNVSIFDNFLLAQNHEIHQPANVFRGSGPTGRNIFKTSQKGAQKSSKNIPNGARGAPENHRKNHYRKNLEKVTRNSPKMKKLSSKKASDFFENRNGWGRADRDPPSRAGRKSSHGQKSSIHQSM